MGKGDKKTKRGKIILGSFGVRRPRRPKALAPAIKAKEKVEKVKVEKAKPIKQKEEVVELIAEPLIAEVVTKAEKKPAVAEKKAVQPKKSAAEPHSEKAKPTDTAKASKKHVADEKKTTKPKSPGKDKAKTVKSAE
jgi:30S ribosomal protein S31